MSDITWTNLFTFVNILKLEWKPNFFMCVLAWTMRNSDSWFNAISGHGVENTSEGHWHLD